MLGYYLPDISDALTGLAGLAVGTISDYDFAEFVRWLFRVHQIFNTDYDGLAAARRMTRALLDDAPAPGVAVPVRFGDWELLTRAAKAPGMAYEPRPGHRVLPYIEAIIEASDPDKEKQP